MIDATPASTSVFCAVWSKDAYRHSLLRSHLVPQYLRVDRLRALQHLGDIELCQRSRPAPFAHRRCALSIRKQRRNCVCQRLGVSGGHRESCLPIEHDFWRFFCPEIREFAASIGKENFLMFGEAFDGDDELIGSYTFNDGVDSVFYFSHKFWVFNDVFMYGQPTA